MTKQLYILTGASRGMGAAIAEQLLQAGNTLLCISRGTHLRLADIAASTGATTLQWALDLAEPASVAKRLGEWLESTSADEYDSATLINNAASMPNPTPIEQADPAELQRALRVGLEAPLFLTAAFLRATQHWRARREGQVKVLNISSGLGRRAIASQASYCAVKAGMDHFSRSVALDQGHAKHPAHIVSLAPGIVDTDMQAQLRAGDAASFPDHALFLQLKQEGHLDTPSVAAAKIVAYLHRADFGSTPVADVRDA